MEVEAILFDLDDTLVVDEAVSREAMASVAAEAARLHGVAAADFLLTARTIRGRFWSENPFRADCERLGISFEEVLYGRFDPEGPDWYLGFRQWALDARVRFFDAILTGHGIHDEAAAAELAKRFAVTRRKRQRLMPDAREVLARLAGSFRLGLLTNGAPSIQQEKIDDSGLSSFFQGILISGACGIGKPDPAVFHLAAEMLGVAPSRCAMVGNSQQRDIVGSKAAGFARAIWLHVVGSEENSEAVRPDVTVSALHELPAKLFQERPIPAVPPIPPVR
ncbi:MAG: HAD family hydrolase [Terrimicrobiaceae bacterium]|nr:HAD family hydrolase [Terrimicrobiaceae bacterium]